MLKKITVGLLLITVIAGAVFALFEQPTLSPVESPTLAVENSTNTQTSNSSVGEVWSARATILEIGTVGMTVSLEDDTVVYIELGSPEYWQSQGISLNAGESVSIDGFFNGTDYHARTVTLADGSMLTLRDEAGQPLWSGGTGNGANSGQGQVQIAPEDWLTIDGTVTSLMNNGLVLQTSTGEILALSFGRADFWQSQAVSFNLGDSISVLGFWQDGQFQAGQVTKTATGERILLRDPNGRPLWAGRGQGNGNQAHATSTANQ